MSTLTRSNPRAFTEVLPSTSHPHPDNPLSDRYPASPGLYLSEQLSEEEDNDSWSDGDTPIPDMTHKRWSDTTLTESLTGRSSFCSWGEDEGVLDRMAGETVGRMFDAIDMALYEGRPTGQEQVDRECTEWNTYFPHLRVNGTHLIDSLEDGTEIVDPVLIEENDIVDDEGEKDKPIMLAIVGHNIKLLPPPPSTTGSPPNNNPGLHYEEIIASNGVVEEYFAFNAVSETGMDLKRASRHHRSCHLPPVTPSECVRDTVFSVVFNQVWSEIATVLQPLLLKHKALQSRRNSLSEKISLIQSNQVPIHEFYLPTNADLPPPTRSGLQSLKKKPLTSGVLGPVVTSHTTDLPSLQKVMTIKPVPLQQRLPSSLPLSSALSSISGTGSMLFHDPSFVSSRPLFNIRSGPSSQTPLPPRASEPKIISGKMGNRRNPLKPLEIPRTPGIPPTLDEDIREFSGLIGQRLVRHTQLPPLDKTQLECNKSPPQLPRSSGTKGRVTFSNRLVSAATDINDGGRHSRRQMTSTIDPRPNTSQTFRSETPLVRRGSNHSVGMPPSPIKIIGHAASLHNDLVLWEEQEEGHQDKAPPFMLTSSKPKSGLTRSSKLTRSQIK